MVKKIHFMLCIFYQNNKKKLSGPHPRLIPSESLGRSPIIFKAAQVIPVRGHSYLRVALTLISGSSGLNCAILRKSFPGHLFSLTSCVYPLIDLTILLDCKLHEGPLRLLFIAASPRHRMEGLAYRRCSMGVY